MELLLEIIKEEISISIKRKKDKILDIIENNNIELNSNKENEVNKLKHQISVLEKCKINLPIYFEMLQENLEN